MTLAILGKFKSGTLKIRGLAKINGKLSSVSVGDAGDIKINGRLTSGGVSGPFTLTGACA